MCTKALMQFGKLFFFFFSITTVFKFSIWKNSAWLLNVLLDVVVTVCRLFLFRVCYFQIVTYSSQFISLYLVALKKGVSWPVNSLPLKISNLGKTKCNEFLSFEKLKNFT